MSTSVLDQLYINSTCFIFYIFDENVHDILVYPVCGQSCPTLCDPMDCSPPGFSAHRVLQARTLEWAVIPYSRRSSWLGDRTHIPYVSCLGRFFSISTFQSKKEKKHLILGRKSWHFLPPPGPCTGSPKMKVHFETRNSSQDRTCLAQACSDSLLFRNGNIRSLQWHSGTCRSLSFLKRKKFPQEG